MKDIYSSTDAHLSKCLSDNAYKTIKMYINERGPPILKGKLWYNNNI